MTEVIDAPSRKPRGTTLVWAARIFLALVFVYVGAIKFPGGQGLWVRVFDQIGFGQWFRIFTAAVEVLAGALMLVPRATPVAVFLAGSVMVGALITHATVVGFGPPTVVVSFLLLLILSVARSHFTRSVRL